jgi:hypothetical protein
LRDPISEKPHHKKGLAEWLEVKALSSSPSTGKRKKKLFLNSWMYCHNLSKFRIPLLITVSTLKVEIFLTLHLQCLPHPHTSISVSLKNKLTQGSFGF